LSARFKADGEEDLEAEEIEEFLDDLVQARLMYREENCFLSLAIPARMTSTVLEASSGTDAG
jgi:hypothetical protein